MAYAIKRAQAEWVSAFLTSKGKCEVNVDDPDQRVDFDP
jgi:hypothetical protein